MMYYYQQYMIFLEINVDFEEGGNLVNLDLYHWSKDGANNKQNACTCLTLQVPGMELRQSCTPNLYMIPLFALMQAKALYSFGSSVKRSVY